MSQRYRDLSKVESLIVDSLERAGDYQSFDWKPAMEAIGEAKALVDRLHDEIDCMRTTKSGELHPERRTAYENVVQIARRWAHDVGWDSEAGVVLRALAWTVEENISAAAPSQAPASSPGCPDR